MDRNDNQVSQLKNLNKKTSRFSIGIKTTSRTGKKRVDDKI